jgi:ornithine carbamoyltransferase
MMGARIYDHAALNAPPEPPKVGRHLVSVQDFSPEEIKSLFELTHIIKHRPADFRAALTGKQLVLFFEKASLRTRLTFEAGMSSLGGATFFVDQTRSRMQDRETLRDIAHNVERWVDAVVVRTFEHDTVLEISQNSCIPVINALSDLEHPCQALADFFTLQEKFGDVSRLNLAYVGDGNNVAHSLMLAAASMGSKISIATPEGYAPHPQITAAALGIAASTGAQINITHDPWAVVSGADAVYTDVWTSMGCEAEATQRKALFAPYQVSDDLFAHAAPHAVFMHCLPAHREEEVATSVIDSPRSVIFDQAENRMHVQKAILLQLLGGGIRRRALRSNHA